ncbi:Uu.00g029250.m01.CDS01 [Anthostomella pinea]|uniref:Uu.00g029250.m01.CDS01 n=1 Tax=Anthostomella pinea TaxID=933095 RepID=A0AAI8YCW0_9PEZI|nr:Uu.00g029250.m01.CDS01 [Anthostomella pinea]
MGCTGSELNSLVSGLTKYLEAYEFTKGFVIGQDTKTDDEGDAASFASEVDMMFSSSNYPKTAFIDTDEKRDKVDAMRLTLQKMAQGAEPDVALAQLLGYFECDREMAGHGSLDLLDHRWTPDKGNYAQWLLMSIMKSSNIEPDLVVTVVIRTWAPGQLPSLEIIGTVLGIGGSLGEEAGLNVTWPGETRDEVDRDFSQDERDATCLRKHLRGNVDARQAALDYLDTFNVDAETKAISDDINKLDELYRRMKPEAEKLMAEMEEESKTIALQMERQKKHYAELLEIIRLADMILG